MEMSPLPQDSNRLCYDTQIFTSLVDSLKQRSSILKSADERDDGNVGNGNG